MSDFENAVNVTARVFGQTVTYAPPGGTPVQTVRVISRRPDEIVSALGSGIHSRTAYFEVAVSELASPQKDGTITLGATVYKIQSKPEYKDDLRLVWLLNTYEQF